MDSLLDSYRDRFLAHLGRNCMSPALEQATQIDHLDEYHVPVELGRNYHRRQSDWSYVPADSD